MYPFFPLFSVTDRQSGCFEWGVCDAFFRVPALCFVMGNTCHLTHTRIQCVDKALLERISEEKTISSDGRFSRHDSLPHYSGREHFHE